jgi:hypothetical protein
MKTSNKLLLGLFAIVVIGLIIINFTLKSRMDSKLKSNTQIETISTDSASTAAGDSVEMEKAIGNE